MAAADLSTAVRYSQLAAVPISRYASQFGPNQATVSPSPVLFAVNSPDGRYNDQTLQGWVNQIVLQANPAGKSCVVILNPPGIVNTDADPGQGIGGYHGAASVPYCFVNAMGSGFTMADPQDVYALALSHEIAEMVVDPEANLANPEICDPCGPNCQTPWIDYFEATGGYLGTSQSFPPPFPYGFFINGIVKPNAATACPAPAAACNYAPP